MTALYLVATPCGIEVRFQKKKCLPFHSQFGRVSRRGFEFVARLSEPIVTESSHLWHRIYHETDSDSGEVQAIRLTNRDRTRTV